MGKKNNTSEAQALGNHKRERWTNRRNLARLGCKITSIRLLIDLAASYSVFHLRVIP